MNRAVLLRLEQKLDRQVARKAQELRSIIVETLSQPGSGRIYNKTRTTQARDDKGRFVKGSKTTSKVAHQASAPGEPPAVDTGQYRQSWQVRKRAQAEYAVGTNQERAPALEFGSRTIAPRPHARPSVETFKAKQ